MSSIWISALAFAASGLADCFSEAWGNILYFIGFIWMACAILEFAS